jgi:hypothetical protein
MKVIAAMLAGLCVSLVPSASGQSTRDSCHVYVVDVKATIQFREKTDFEAFSKKSKSEQESMMNAAGVGKTFDPFATKVGEEELTTKTYPFPGGKLVITASVFYTDESMASSKHSESMLIGIALGPKGFENALEPADAAIAEVSYDANLDVVRVKRNAMVNGREYLLGLECRCKQSASIEKK